jgi:hypothetical protein
VEGVTKAMMNQYEISTGKIAPDLKYDWKKYPRAWIDLLWKNIIIRTG